MVGKGEEARWGTVVRITRRIQMRGHTPLQNIGGIVEVVTEEEGEVVGEGVTPHHIGKIG